MGALRDVTLLAVAVRVLAALLCGGLIGMDRGLKKRAAGMRTYMLVSVGACLIMLTNQYIYQVTNVGDPMRMGAQVVSGIGFLGAGTIIVTKQNHIKGLTTAAGLWAAAAVGLALGLGFYEAALIGGLAVFIILTAMNWIDNKVHSKNKYLDLHIILGDSLKLDKFIEIANELDCSVESIQIEDDARLTDGVWAMYAVLKITRSRHRNAVLAQLRTTTGIIHLEEI
ncbi:MAG: MgtC/SapB family protein [Ruminococcaceae bacterium]|nr:MgtC/SapB family protein [Oscillospiraceae bacterium]